MIKTFFSRPGSKKDIEEAIIKDIEKAKSRVLIASAFFNSAQIAQALVNKPINDKRVILNVNDTNRFKSKEVRDILHYGNISYCEVGTIYSNYTEAYKTGTHMHHKFIIIDDVVWVGSYNLTDEAATRNWENMLRIDIKNITEEYLKEFEQIWLVGWAIQSKIIVNRCTDCTNMVEDPLDHFQILIGDSFHESMIQYEIQCRNLAQIFSFPIQCSYCDEEYLSHDIFWRPDETKWETNGYKTLCKHCFPLERLSFRNTVRALAEANRLSYEDEFNQLKYMESVMFGEGETDN